MLNASAGRMSQPRGCAVGRRRRARITTNGWQLTKLDLDVCLHGLAAGSVRVQRSPAGDDVARARPPAPSSTRASVWRPPPPRRSSPARSAGRPPARRPRGRKTSPRLRSPVARRSGTPPPPGNAPGEPRAYGERAPVAGWSSPYGEPTPRSVHGYGKPRRVALPWVRGTSTWRSLTLSSADRADRCRRVLRLPFPPVRP